MKTIMRFTKTVGIALMALAALSAQPTNVKRAQGLMQAAQTKETIDGDLKGAIDLYRQAARSAGSDRKLGAQALLRLAECQEKIGAVEAKKTYEEILRSYGDQTDAVEVARQKLRGATGSSLTAHKVWNGPEFGRAGGVSPDGRFWAYIEQDSYKVILFDVVRGEKSILFEGSGMTPFFSPDGRKVGFGAETSSGDEFAVKTLGSDAPAIVKPVQFRSWSLLGWFPDSERVLIRGSNETRGGDMVLASLRLADGAMNEICRIAKDEHLNDARGLVSADGKYVVFDRKHSPVNADRDVFVVPASGGTPQPLIAEPSEDTALAFTPDGRYLLFRSSRSLKSGLYGVRFAEGKTQAEPVLVSSSLSVDQGGMFDRAGNFYHSAVTGGEMQLHTAGIDLATGKVTSPLKRLPMARGAGEIPWASWIADGKSIVFHRHGPAHMIDVAIADAETGREEKSLQTQLPMAYGAFVRPDGSTALNIPGQPSRYGNVNWEKGTLEMGQLTEGKAPASLCGGPTTQISTDGKGIRIRDYSTNRTWLLQERTDLSDSSTIVDVTPDCRHMVRLAQNGSILYTALATGVERVLSNAPAGRESGFPRLSPDGKRVVFVVATKGVRMRELWSIPLSAGAAAPTGIELVNMRHPRFRPDGKRLLLNGGRYNFEAFRVENLLPASLRGAK